MKKITKIDKNEEWITKMKKKDNLQVLYIFET